MRRMHRRVVAALVVGVALVGCGDDDAGAECAVSSDCAAAESCVDGTCVMRADAGPGADGGPGFDGGPDFDGGPPVGAGCSEDLRSVLGAGGEVLHTCPVDQGCSEGVCIEACSAAAASGGNVGCGFRLATPPSYPPALPPCFAVFLANQSPAPARVSVSRAGTTFDVTAFARIAEAGRPEAEWATVPADGIPPDAVAVLFLSSDPESVMPETGIPLSCPVTPAVDASTVLGASGVGDAFAIATSAPVAAYDMLPYGGAPSHFPSAQLVLPESVWGTEHVVLGTPPGTHSSPGPLWVQVIARQDGTEVRVRPVVDLPGGGGAPAAPAGDVTSVTLSAGQYAQWELPVGAPDLAGSIVASDAPVAVLSGNRFFRLQDAPGPGGESTHQQIPPASALAHEYVAAPYETRRADLAPETIHYRLVGAIDGTMLAYDPPVTGAPATLAQGEVADFTATVAFVVRSQDATHPFAAAQIMPSANVPGGSRPGATFVHPTVESRLGDEELVVMLPPAQYLRRYVFFTDPSYATTSLTITRVAESGAFSPVTLECLGEVGGWIAAGTDGRFEVTTVDLVRADLGNAGCTNGRQVAASDAPFGIVVWGLDTYSSYAYPAGGNARSLAELPPLI